ncbi:hypothetical protein B0A49_10823 [Cryomyces minteri]|uniref:Major facilitator superfamily (MFS) profile domain-containing protein n=1 Tax=Cryomyces minteri TaxID=331657 RepID=A0A4U0VZP2_9PEZI|nr:hypothetical protein B0A49_10823 [Cryomyces minteri]
MPEHEVSATETSPLLPKNASSLQSVPSKTIEPSDGRAPNGAIANGSLNKPSSLSSSSASTHSSDSIDGGDLERQSTTASAADRKRKAEGLPDVKKKMKYILPALAIGIFLSAADQTIILDCYGVSLRAYTPSTNKSREVLRVPGSSRYFLTLTSFQPLYGKLSDIFTRKSCLLFAYLVFGLGCLFCGLARNMNELIAARAFAGIGGGGMTTVVSILLSDTVPLRERGKWQGYVNIIYATGAGVGAPLGGILADYIGWRWAFLFQAPLCLVAFLAVSMILKLPARDQSNWKAKLRRIDFLGAVILIAAVFTLLLGLDRGSNVSWRDKVTLVALCTSLPLFAIFIGVEMKVAAEPFAPGHIIFERTLFACYLCNFFSFCGWLAALFYIPLFFQAVDGLSATQAGVRLIPGIICGVSGSLFAGFYMQRTAKYYWLTVIAYSCLVIGMTTIFLFSGIIANSTLGMIAGMCVCGFSNGIGVTTSLIALIANSSHEDQAVATACSYLFRSLGSVFGVSLSATVANATLRSSLVDALGSGTAAADIAARVRESLGYIGTLEPAVRDLVRQCYAKSTRAAFGLEIGLVAGAAVAAWFIRERALSR